MSKKLFAVSSIFLSQLGLVFPISALQSSSVSLLVNGSVAAKPFWSSSYGSDDDSEDSEDDAHANQQNAISSITYIFSGIANSNSQVFSQRMPIKLNNRVANSPEQIFVTAPSQCTIGGTAVSNAQFRINGVAISGSQLSISEISQFQQASGAQTDLVLANVGSASGVVVCNHAGSLLYSF